MKNLLIKRILIAFIFLILPICFLAEGNISVAKIDTRPITLPAEEVKQTPAVEKATAVDIKQKSIQQIPQTQLTKPTTIKVVKKPIQQSKVAQKTNIQTNNIQRNNKTTQKPKLEVLQFDSDYNIVGTNDTDSYLIVPIDKSKLKKEETKAKMDELSSSLMKDSPKPLTTELKIKSKFHQNLGNKTHRLLSRIKHSRIFKFFTSILSIILVLALSYLAYMIYQRRMTEEQEIVEEEEKPLTPEEKEHLELIQAMKEFEETEEKHEKLGQRNYFNETDMFRNTDGFKKEEISEDILKTLKSIENAQKNETPLTLRDSSTDGFKRSEYAFEERIGDISDEEAMALLDDDEEDETPSELDDLALNYYGGTSEILSPEKIDNEIFIIEDEDEPQQYDIVEETPEEEEPIEEAPQEEVVEEVKEEPKKEDKSDIENLHIKEKYPIDENRGLSLINYHNTDALIGYIGSKITVLKKFAKSDNATNLSVRVHEKLSFDKTQYMVRIGQFKGIVEVTDTDVKLLLDL